MVPKLFPTNLSSDISFLFVFFCMGTKTSAVPPSSCSKGSYIQAQALQQHGTKGEALNLEWHEFQSELLLSVAY